MLTFESRSKESLILKLVELVEGIIFLGTAFCSDASETEVMVGLSTEFIIRVFGVKIRALTRDLEGMEELFASQIILQ